MSVAGYVMNAGNHVLFLVIEANSGNMGNIQNKYLDNRLSFRYEDEAIRCVRSWRKFGPDIPIIVMCVNSNPPSEETISLLKELGCQYVHDPRPEADGYKCGYWNVPLAGYLFEQTLPPETFIIHIDLDMTLFRKLDQTLFENLDETTRIAINEFRPTRQHKVAIEGPIYDFEINTGFIYSKAKNHFYHDWYHKLKEKTAILDWDDPSYSIWEERICDVMYFDEGYPFSFFKPFQINGPLDKYSNLELKHICFNHCHIEHAERGIRQLEEYLRRCK